MQNSPVTEADTVAPKAYSGVADLNEAQKLDLKEIWEHAAAITSAHIVLDATTEQDFLRAIFAGSWNSDTKPMRPSEPSRSSQESSFAAGFFKEDLPGTNGEPQDDPFRKGGATAMLRVNVDDNKNLSWMWTDVGGLIANKEFVQMTALEEDLKVACVLQYDTGVRTRLVPYISAVAVYIARFRVQAWSKHGFTNGLDGEGKKNAYGGETRRFALFRPVVFCHDIIDELSKTLEILRRAVPSNHMDS